MKPYLIIILLVLFSCNSSKIGGDEYTIIEYGNNSWTFMFENATPSTLSENEIHQAEIIIHERVEDHKAFFTEWEEEYLQINTPVIFRRQYVPVFLENGDKAIWINFLCSLSDHEEWKENLIIVDDGGPCYFQVKVNLTKKKYYEFQYNGVAMN